MSNNGSSCDAPGNPYNGGCEDYCDANPNDDICQNLCTGDPESWSDEQRNFCINTGITVPIDDYLPLLMLAGIAYAAIRLRQ